MYLLYQHALSQCDGCVSGEGSAGVQRSAIGFEQRFPEHLAEGRVRVNVARGSAQWNMVAYDLLCLGDQIAGVGGDDMHAEHMNVIRLICGLLPAHHRH